MKSAGRWSTLVFILLSSPLAHADDITLESSPPVVVKTIPESGQKDVDPKLAEIKVTFSKPMMDKSWSSVTLSKETFPDITGQPKYLADRCTFVLPVKLVAGKNLRHPAELGKIQKLQRCRRPLGDAVSAGLQNCGRTGSGRRFRRGGIAKMDRGVRRPGVRQPVERDGPQVRLFHLETGCRLAGAQGQVPSAVAESEESAGVCRGDQTHVGRATRHSCVDRNAHRPGPAVWQRLRLQRQSSRRSCDARGTGFAVASLLSSPRRSPMALDTS